MTTKLIIGVNLRITKILSMLVSNLFVINVNTKLLDKATSLIIRREYTYPCDQCDFKASHKRSLKTHQSSRHKGIKYPCDQCNYKASQKGNLKIHKNAVHGGVKYPCNQCEYKATTKGSLNVHINC